MSEFFLILSVIEGYSLGKVPPTRDLYEISYLLRPVKVKDRFGCNSSESHSDNEGDPLTIRNVNLRVAGFLDNLFRARPSSPKALGS